jgi:hypothetical protein
MARFWQERLSQLIDRMSLTGGLRRVATVILGLALRVPESRLGFQVGAELNSSACLIFRVFGHPVATLCPLWRPHSPPSPSLRQLGFLSQAAFQKKPRMPGPVCRRRQPRPDKKPHVAAHRPHVAPSRARSGHMATPAKKANTGATSAQSPKEPANRRPPGWRQRYAPPARGSACGGYCRSGSTGQPASARFGYC